jgi:hypothetical protein
MSNPEVKTFYFKDDGSIPNNPDLPVLFYPGALKEKAEQAEKIFNENNWLNSWTNGVFDYHHYHSNAHEVLGVMSGSAGIPADLFTGTAHAELNDDVKLQFNPDGKFKIVQFNDTQDDEHIDRRTVQLMEKVLDEEKPDFVVLNGDNITGGCDTPTEMKKAINNVAQPMEQRGIKWAVTFGNHDEDSTPKSGLNEEDMLKIYMSYKYNMNKPSVKGITGTGNMNLLIKNSKGTDASFNLWLLDSGRYAPQTIAGQDFEGYPTWD